MAFSTGTAASWASLASAMDTFLTTTLGFTTTYLNGTAESTANSDAATWELDGFYWNFDYAPAQFGGAIRCWPSTGNDGPGTLFHLHTGSAYNSNSQDNGAAQVNAVDFVSPVDYWFFGDQTSASGQDVFFMVLSPTAGVYHHFWLGYIDPYWGAARPYGGFVAASQVISGSVRGPASGSPNGGNNMSMMHYPYSAAPVGDQTSIFYNVVNRLSDEWCSGIGMNESTGSNVVNALEFLIRPGQSQLTGRTLLGPNPAIISNQTGFTTAATNRVIVAGQYPYVHQISLEGLNVEDLLVVGPDTYQVFPMLTRGSDTDNTPFIPTMAGGVGDTGVIGFAYKRF